MSNPCRQTHPSRAVQAALLVSLGVLQAAPAFAKGFETVAVLPPSIGASYLSGLAADTQGRLYGTGYGGGAFGWGYVYRITPGVLTGDPWTFETLHSFNYADGANSAGSLTIGSAGEIYGTATSGGAYGYGTAFRLDNVTGWPLTTLHSFGAKGDVGSDPRGPLVFGLNGLLYGTTIYSHRHDLGGVVFSLSPLGDSVSYTIIHKFHTQAGAAGGFDPNGDLVATRNGDIYGTTYAGGLTTASFGTFFKLSLTDRGVWQYRILYDFAYNGNSLGDNLPMSLVRAGDGTFYGCASNDNGLGGSVYAITPPANGSKIWTESTPYIFSPSDGGATTTVCDAVAVNPEGGLVVTNVMQNSTFPDTTEGKVLQLLPPAMVGAPWTTVTIHDFGMTSLSFPNYPISPLLRQGSLYYGVTIPDQSVNGGTVYHARP